MQHIKSLQPAAISHDYWSCLSFFSCSMTRLQSSLQMPSLVSWHLLATFTLKKKILWQKENVDFYYSVNKNSCIIRENIIFIKRCLSRTVLQRLETSKLAWQCSALFSPAQQNTMLTASLSPVSCNSLVSPKVSLQGCMCSFLLYYFCLYRSHVLYSQSQRQCFSVPCPVSLTST